MDIFVGDLGQFRHVTPDEFAFRVKLFGLRHRVENPEIGLGIAAAGGRPLPAAVVGREIEIIELFGEVSLAMPPVDAEILGQERGDDHAQPVVHPAAVLELAHRRINQRIAGPALAPGGQSLRPVCPLNGVVLRLEGMTGHVRVAVENHEIEIPPDQFAEPDIGFSPDCFADQLADR